MLAFLFKKSGGCLLPELLRQHVPQKRATALAL
jgi:hypothetical protein